jgi:protein TonB
MLSVLASLLMQAATPAPPSDPGFRYYPERAQAERVEGVATLDCAVTQEGALKCAVLTESPPGWGFGPTALRLATLFHMKPTADGSSAGRRIQVPIRFKLPPGSGPPEKDPGRGPLP